MKLIVLIPATYRTQANNFLQKNGLGDGNFSIEIERVSNSNLVGVGAVLQLDSHVIALVKQMKQYMDTNSLQYQIKQVTSRSRKQLRAFLDERGLRIRSSDG